MSTAAEVRLWGTIIGAVAYDDREKAASFEYSEDFLHSGIEPSPLMMPLSSKVYRFPELSETFHGLPGMLADSLPDKFGNAVIEAWLMRQGRAIDSFNAVERLCYMGTRGMGALEFYPTMRSEDRNAEPLNIAELVSLASKILEQRDSFNLELGSEDTESLSQILKVGTSAGGARAKAVIAINPKTNNVLSGQVHAPKGYEYWLLKFDGISSNKDKELSDPNGYCVIEHIYYKMALAAGITMQPSRLYKEHGRRHFMTKRFDRLDSGEKLHMQTLGAIAHLDYNMPAVHSYEQAFSVIRSLGLSADQREEMFRRMVFNVVARNQDDHVKNISFLMDKSGVWRLSPAYDVTYSYQPGGTWTGQHQMSIHGKRDDFQYDDLKAAAKDAGILRGHEKIIIEQVCDAVALWPKLAAEEGLSAKKISQIQGTLCLYLGTT